MGYTRQALTYCQAVNDNIKEMSTKVKSKAISAAEAPLIAASFTPNFITVAGDLETRLRTLLGDQAGASRSERVAGGFFRLLDRTMSMVLGDGKTESNPADAAAATGGSGPGGGLAAGYVAPPATATIISSPLDSALIGAHRRASGGDMAPPNMTGFVGGAPVAAAAAGMPTPSPYAFGGSVNGPSYPPTMGGGEGQFLGAAPSPAPPVVGRQNSGAAPSTPYPPQMGGGIAPPSVTTPTSAMHPRDLRRLSSATATAAPTPQPMPPLSHSTSSSGLYASPPPPSGPHQRAHSLGAADWHTSPPPPSQSPMPSGGLGGGSFTDSPSHATSAAATAGGHTRGASEGSAAGGGRAPLPSPTSDKAAAKKDPSSSPETPSTGKSGILGRVKGWFGVKEPKRVNLDAAQTKFRFDESTGRYIFDDDDGSGGNKEEEVAALPPPPPPPPMMKSSVSGDGMPSSPTNGSDAAGPPMMPSMAGNAFAKKAGGVGSRYALANTLVGGRPSGSLNPMMLGPRMPGDEPFDAGSAPPPAMPEPIPSSGASSGGPPSRYAPLSTGGYPPSAPGGPQYASMARSPSDPSGLHAPPSHGYPSSGIAPPPTATVGGGGYGHPIGGGAGYQPPPMAPSQMRSTTPHPTRPTASVEAERSQSTPRARPPMPGMPGMSPSNNASPMGYPPMPPSNGMPLPPTYPPHHGGPPPGAYGRPSYPQYNAAR
jgi:hypothetical protein